MMGKHVPMVTVVLTSFLKLNERLYVPMKGYLYSYGAAGHWAPLPQCPPSPLGASDGAGRTSPGQSHLEVPTKITR